MRVPLALVALLLLAPTAAACDGLSPGDQIQSGGALCTLAFLVADPTGLYFMTAGHCLEEGARVESPGVGEWGTAAFVYAEGTDSAGNPGSPGNDFALIRVDPDLYGELNPKMCGWDGPTGVFREHVTSGDVRHYGHGLVFGDFSQTRGREGYNLHFEGGPTFTWTGQGVSGDSGSAVIHADGRALGVFTHGGTSINPGDPSDVLENNEGTHMDRALQLATDAGYDLRLVLMGEDPLAVLAQVQGRPLPDASEGEDAGGNETAPLDPDEEELEEPDANATHSATPPPRHEEDALDAAAVDEEGDAGVPGFAPMGALLAAALVAAWRRRA